jgi:hydroxymethylglutaryl-CoA reductase
MKNILTDYIDNSYFEIKCSLDGGYALFVKWNIFNDKKDNNKLVMRTRYVLKNKDGERKSLKELNLRMPVEFKQIYLDDVKLSQCQFGSVAFIATYFSNWFNGEFTDMINSGDYKITSVEILPCVNNCTYLFFRADGFYPLELKDDEDAIANAERNKGTLQVKDLNGRIVWAIC